MPAGLTRLFTDTQHPSRTRRGSLRAASSVHLYPAPHQGVVDDQHNDGADGRDHHAVNAEAGYAGHSESGKEPPPHEGADHAENDIEHYALAGLIDQFARDEPGNEPK